MPVRRLNHAVLCVRDLARAVSFYRGTLGLEVRTEVPAGPPFCAHPTPTVIGRVLGRIRQFLCP